MRLMPWVLMAACCLSNGALAASPAQSETLQEGNETQDNAANAAIASVAVKGSRQTAELPYRVYLEVQHQLQTFLPAEPKLVDMWFRVGHADMAESERDAYAPQSWTVNLKSHSVDVNVPMRRGAYLSLPESQDAYDEDGTILVNGAARAWLSIWWTLRVPPSQKMAYADIRSARAQIAGVQAKISAFAASLKKIKHEPYDGIKACFHDGSGAILVKGKAFADASEGNCKILFHDPGLTASEASIEFIGPLDVVSFIDRRYFTRK